MRNIYIASPYRSTTLEDKNRNLRYAREVAREVALRGDNPIVPHLLLPQFLNDNKQEERGLGIHLAIESLKGCQKIIVCRKYGISSGMQLELDMAKALDIEIVEIKEVSEVGGI